MSVSLDHLVVPAAPYRKKFSATLASTPEQPFNSMAEKLRGVTAPTPEKSEKEQRVQDALAHIETVRAEASKAQEALVEPAPAPIEAKAAPIKDAAARARTIGELRQKRSEESGGAVAPKVFASIDEEAKFYREKLLADPTNEQLKRTVAGYESKVAPKPEPTPAAPEQKRVRVGDIVTEGGTRARVLEVNAEGRPTRLRTFEKKEASEQRSDREAEELAIGEGMEQPMPVQSPSIESQQVRIAPSTPEGQKIKEARRVTEKLIHVDADDAAREALTESSRQQSAGKFGAEAEEAAEQARERAAHKNTQKQEAPLPSDEELLGTIHRPIEEQPYQPTPAPEKREPKDSMIFGILRGPFEMAIKRSGARPYLETIAPRLDAFYNRQFAEHRAFQQEAAQRRVGRYQDKLNDWAYKAEQSTFPPLKAFALARRRAWEKATNKAIARVNQIDTFRVQRQERHNTLQKQVVDRYQLEMAPYKGASERLKKQEVQEIESSKALRVRREEALKVLGEAEAARSGLFDWKGKAVAGQIRQKIKDIDRRLAMADKALSRVQKPLAMAQAQIERYEARIRTTNDLMAFSETKKLRRASSRGSLSSPEAQYVGGEQEQSAEPLEPKLREEWKPEGFVKQWNLMKYQPAFVDSVAFTGFVNEREQAAGRTGDVPLIALLEHAREYLRKQNASPKDMRTFEDQARIFVREEKK